ncbi:hypothetical protein N7532_010457 [Penicillium argentinense]|uniref:Uncharacterized protein n=1 Tax=Penicillium argentinense TaxID=1131581 RepID=A0A9W9EPQ3_9EURO|nr:uncharacterized protein N7532_010457 [Penicillium argentinense]KAJ5085686.1 hypothetical protein N7532_010457 [Penicillium argentinense]
MPPKPSKLFVDHPFMRYAANFWPYHGAFCSLEDHQQQMVHRLFATRSLPGGGNYSTWVQALFGQRDASMQIDPAVIQTTHPLYYATSFGMVPVVNALLKSEPKIDVNAPGGRTGATAVWIASMRFNFEVVKVLL